MLCELKKINEKGELRIHPGKTKILSNQSSDTRKEIEVDNISPNTDKRKREILGPADYFPATGDDRNQKSNLGCVGDVSKYRQELTSKNYLLKHRLRLFDAVITPTICYASGTWTPTKEHESRRNAKCSDSSFKRKEDTKRSRNKKKEQRKKRHQQLE